MTRFVVDEGLLAHCRATLAERSGLRWLIGGAGAGKSTVSAWLAAATGLPLIDMDAHIYGTYHARFTPARHPVNAQWSAAENPLAWLLSLSWAEFDAFNRAALVEYLDLLAEDLSAVPLDAGLLVDGGVCNPALLASVIPPRQIVCLAAPEIGSEALWTTEARAEMGEMIRQLPNGEEAWRTFLAFDRSITATVLHESRLSGIAVCVRGEGEPVTSVAARVADAVGLVLPAQ